MLLFATAVILVASVAVAALPVLLPEDPETSPVTLPVKVPTKVVEVKKLGMCGSPGRFHGRLHAQKRDEKKRGSARKRKRGKGI